MGLLSESIEMEELKHNGKVVNTRFHVTDEKKLIKWIWDGLSGPRGEQSKHDREIEKNKKDRENYQLTKDLALYGCANWCPDGVNRGMVTCTPEEQKQYQKELGMSDTVDAIKGFIYGVLILAFIIFFIYGVYDVFTTPVKLISNYNITKSNDIIRILGYNENKQLVFDDVIDKNLVFDTNYKQNVIFADDISVIMKNGKTYNYFFCNDKTSVEFLKLLKFHVGE